MQRGNKKIIFHSHDYAIIKESETFYGVYEYDFVLEDTLFNLITSGKTFDSAKKKLKLLQMGYDRRKNEGDDF